MSIKVEDVNVNGINLHTIETNKYKTNTIVLHIKAPLEKETVTARALLPYVLQSGTQTYPTRLEIRSHLDELYGSTLTVDVSKKGEHQILSFRMDVANENFLKDKTPLLEEALKLLAEILLNPVKEAGVFHSATLANEKRNLKQRIQSIFDDKIRYANMRITEEMCKQEPYGLSVWGYEKEIDSLTTDQLFNQYQKMLENDQIDLYIVGDVSAKNILQLVEKYFLFPKQRKEQATNNLDKQEVKSISEENVVIEEQDIKQGKLHIGFRTHTTFNDDDYFAMQMFNGLFGGFSHSKLFINVREKASLAYYASSRFESHKGILMVMSGIEFKNYDQAVSIIKEQLKSMQSGDFSDSEIEQTRAVIKNQILETVDVAKGYVELLYHNAVATKSLTIEDWLEGIDKVSKEDIIKVGQKIQLDTIYFLKGKEEK
ncbi:insulinase family protein [Anaerobacillus sp. CMMVII]|uniref:EF-P 5-aminopentanol modification-associated protein YfmF n=1 Tax=Anaerobacillus sp. CMMVII TaxID=2755588 RepID=UPI0021B762DB|nr:pitrilysin family protein [Anaerobacillus sp. CMMVII]MCT8139877.1 insulinase family protein [Anaerobacillus sp. CMMVII]